MRWTWRGTMVLLVGCVLAMSSMAAVASSGCEDTAAQVIPPRPSGAPDGSDFAAQVETLRESAREAAIESELLAGNVPHFLRSTVPVVLQGTLSGGRPVEVTVCVLPDYLAIGSDHDFLRVPMRLATALTVGTRYGFTLPTRKIVDAVYAQAGVHLAPQPLPAGDTMRSTAYYRRHNQMIEAQRASVGAKKGALISGHKKDLVLTNILWRNPERVAIYGWHRGPGSPIQPLSTVHGARYADYSHGVRLVSDTIYVDGKPMPIFTALADPALSRILGGEGPIAEPEHLVQKLSVQRPDAPTVASGG